MNDLLTTFSKKVFFTQRVGTFGKNRTKLSLANIDKQYINGSILAKLGTKQFVRIIVVLRVV